MSNELFNLKYQKLSEISTEETTNQKIHVWYLNYPMCLNALFEVGNYSGRAEDATSPEGHFYSLGYRILVQLPYTVRATCILVEKGFYFEAISLIRNLFESFIQLRYFYNHKEMINPHVFERRIKFKKMFDEIAPGFYKQIYSEQLSEFAHSGIASSMFRIKYGPSGLGETTIGSKFNELGCKYSIKNIIVILFGVLNCIPTLFPQYSNLVTNTTELKRKEAMAWLESVMREDVDGKPEVKEFYDLVNPLIQI